MTKVVGYLRVSDQTQVEGHSLDAQERAIREYCQAHGYELVGLYREEGRSAVSDALTKRPQLQRLLADAKLHKFDIVAVHTLDRLARNLKVLLETISLFAKENITMVSLTESVDWATPEGRLVGQNLGSMAEFFSRMLARHVQKGISERARQGKHLGGLPFGYQTCWQEQAGKRYLSCEAEHPGGVHAHVTEGPAVTELFTRYATGLTTLGELASWLNEQGFRTRNMHKYPDADGNLVGGPMLFTTASVRLILHNAFYAGKIRHREALLLGSHAALTSEATFNAVQALTKARSGRSATFHPHPAKEYLLKGIVKCAWCRLPVWAS